MPKFDVAIMNPPYNKPLCYDIYENVRRNANETVYIGPIQNVYTSLLSDSNCEFYSTSITYMPSRKMNELFNIGIRTECGIVYANKSATTNIEQYKKFWPAMQLFKSIRAKIHNKLNSYLENETKGKFHIRVFDRCAWAPFKGGAASRYESAIKDLDIMPNYTTNGMHLTDEVIQATKDYCGGVAVSCHPHLEKTWKKAVNKLVANNIRTNVHIIVGEEGSTDKFWEIYNEFNDKVEYFVLLPYQKVGRATTNQDLDVEAEWTKLFDSLVDMIS